MLNRRIGFKAPETVAYDNPILCRLSPALPALVPSSAVGNDDFGLHHSVNHHFVRNIVNAARKLREINALSLAD